MVEVSAAAAFAEQEAAVEARRKQNELKAKATRISAAEEESEALRKGLGHSKTVSAKEKQLLERQRDSMHSRLVATDDGRRALEKQLQAQKASAVPLLSPIPPAPIASVPAVVGSGPDPQEMRRRERQREAAKVASLRNSKESEQTQRLNERLHANPD